MRRGHIVTGTFASAASAFMTSPDFERLAPATQASYRRQLERAAAPQMLGALTVSLLRPSIMQAYLDGMASTPGNAINAQAALKRLESWGLVRDLFPQPFMIGTRVAHSKDGHRPWTEEQVALAELNCPPYIARVITLAANTGQRGSDIVKMRWTDLQVHDGRQGINVVQKKTGLQIWIPLTLELSRAIDTWERRPGFLVLKRNGQPLTRPQLSVYWDWQRAHNSALAPLNEAGCVLHGLRATAVVRLRRAGANELQIADMVGMSVQMVSRYCRFAVQKENALAAVHFLDGRTAIPGRKIES